MESEPLPANIVDQLLDRLSTDDTFRTTFAASPETALKQLGHQPTPGQLVCCKPGKLASKETIAATRDEMRQVMVLGKLGQIPNKWDDNGPNKP